MLCSPHHLHHSLRVNSQRAYSLAIMTFIIITIIIIIIIRGALVVRALSSLQCGPGFKSRFRRHMWVEFLLVLSFGPIPIGFSSGTPVSRVPQKTTLPNPNSTRNQVDEVPLRECANTKSLYIFLVIHYQSSSTTSFICLNKNEPTGTGLVPANERFLYCVVVQQRKLQ